LRRRTINHESTPMEYVVQMHSTGKAKMGKHEIYFFGRRLTGLPADQEEEILYDHRRLKPYVPRVQFSHLSFETLENSLMLFDIIVRPRLKAWAAMSISRGPIVFPLASREALISP
jgi:hypothetical protein